MTIQSSNNSLSLRYLDAFEYTWSTSKQQEKPNFCKSLKSFFFGKSVQKKDLENYLTSLKDLQNSHIFTTIQGIPYLNTKTRRIFTPDDIMLKNLENTLQKNKTTTLPALHLQSERFRNYGDTCFINTALKCVLNSLKKETLENIQTRQRELLKSLTEKLTPTQTSSTQTVNPLEYQHHNLVKKNKLIRALQILIDTYFNASNKKTMNTAIRHFINQMFQYGQKNQTHFFKSIFRPNGFSPNGYTVMPGSAADLIPHLLHLIADESLGIYGLTYTTTEQQKIRDKEDNILIRNPIKKQQQHHHQGELVLHINPDNSIQQDFDEMQSTEEKPINLPLVQAYKSNTPQLPPENHTPSVITQHHYSSDLSSLECLFVNPVLHTTSSKQTIKAAKRLMAKLDNNIVLPIKHSGKTNNRYNNGQLYQVTLQPQAIGLHHRRILSRDHKTALIKNTNHKFVHHDDKKISAPKITLSAFHGIPEVIMYTVASIDQAPAMTETAGNT
ncbi:hypothetical protein [Endozoicomonas sp.]|uniref:hypothetical protein n=1 Tax=Endozoicomonas sp. TaxID=1892382 RepID=UPI00383AFA85